MSRTALHVVIVGGGLGGLCLAQGLKKASVSVAVYERDHTPTDRLQGYRIHIEPQGSRALYACLPQSLFESYVATAGSGGNGHRIVTDQLKQIAFFGASSAAATLPPQERDYAVSRITLHELLLSGLDEIVHFDKAFVSYEETPEGKVIAHFADGSTASGDLLVAADGTRSRVFAQAFPHVGRQETGVGAIMGKAPLTPEVRSLLIPGRLDGATTILGPDGYGMFLALFDRSDGASGMATSAIPSSDSAGRVVDPLLDDTGDYLFWALVARNTKAPSAMGAQDMSGAEMQAAVSSVVETWHSNLRQFVRNADPATILYRPLRTSQVIKDWPPTRMTFLGDAIHSMPPTRGIGGNTALRDANLLCAKLTAASQGKLRLPHAVHEYELEMRKYGFAAVRDSLQAMNMIVAENRFFSTAMLKLAGAFA
jgi:2-polyprenyl-6-methoxyphenol hydroxylase-like FAD-dependent oxidoreductase